MTETKKIKLFMLLQVVAAGLSCWCSMSLRELAMEATLLLGILWGFSILISILSLSVEVNFELVSIYIDMCNCGKTMKPFTMQLNRIMDKDNPIALRSGISEIIKNIEESSGEKDLKDMYIQDLKKARSILGFNLK